LLHSPLNDAIKRAQEKGVFVSVYVDDIIGSCNDRALLEVTYQDMQNECARAGLNELWLNLGDGVNQAANLISGATSIPSLNFTPLMTFGN